MSSGENGESADSPATPKKSGVWRIALAVGVPVVAAAVASQLFSAANNAAPDPAANNPPLAFWQTGQFWLYVAAVLTLAVGLLVGIVTKVRESRKKSTAEALVSEYKAKLDSQREQLSRAGNHEREAVAEARLEQLVTVHDQLIPVAVAIADMAQFPLEARGAYVKSVAQACAIALCTTVEKDSVKRPRAAVFISDGDANPPELYAVGCFGRGTKPLPFKAGTDRGDAAFDFVGEGKRGKIWADLSKVSPPGHDGTSEYQTFVSMPITTNAGGYGMVTLDALNANSLTRGHASFAALIAEIMSIALEVGQDGDVTPEDEHYLIEDASPTVENPAPSSDN